MPFSFPNEWTQRTIAKSDQSDLTLRTKIVVKNRLLKYSNLPRGLSHSMQQPRGPLSQDSMTHLLLGPLNHLNSVARQLFQSLSPPHTKPPPPPAIAALTKADTALAEAIQLAHIHQKKQQGIEALKAEVLSLEASWAMMQLEEGRRDLEAIISEGDVHLDAIEQAKADTAVLINISNYRWVIVRCHTLPRAPCIRAESKRIYFCTP